MKHIYKVADWAIPLLYAVFLVSAIAACSVPSVTLSGSGQTAHTTTGNNTIGCETWPDAWLWKPVSEANGNLVILLTTAGATVTVDGEVGINSGASNGYASTVRFSKPGSAYPSGCIVVVNGVSYQIDNPAGRN